jgi:uncharacterized protein involved in exopolysaccharide biosynthesis
MEYISQQEINPLEYWRVLVKRKGLIGIIVGVCFVASVAVSLLLPKTYVSMVSMIPSQLKDSSGILRRVKPISDRWIVILNSRVIEDAVVKRHGLTKVFEVKTTGAASAVLEGMVSVKGSREGIISIRVESKDPQLAADLANTFAGELDKFNKELGLHSGETKMTFVEKRLDKTRRELQKAEDAVKAFRDKNSSIELDNKSRGIITALGSVKGQVMAKELELEVLINYGSANYISNFMVEALMTRLELLHNRLNEFNVWLREDSSSKEGVFILDDVFIHTENTSDLSIQYARLLMDAKIRETFYEFLTQQYKMAITQEAMNVPTMQMLDVARVPKKEIKPNKRRIVVGSTLVALFFAVFLSFLLEYIERIRVEESKRRME